jgi:putative nucleotidyltransferase with HDIG domain
VFAGDHRAIRKSVASIKLMNAVSDKRGEIRELLVESSALVSPPDIVIQLRHAVGAPDSTPEDLASVVMQDPGLGARMLHMANSAMYGLNHRVETLSRAISIIGPTPLYHLAVALTASQTFARLSEEPVNMAAFWHHSVFSALIAHNLARRSRAPHPECLFVAGLLHDLGSLVLCQRYPDSLRKSLLASRDHENALVQKERELFGFDHAEVGGVLLELWGMPKDVQQAVARHHQPTLPMSLPVAIVHLADTLANRTDQGSLSGFGACGKPPHPDTWKRLGLDEGLTEEIWKDVNLQFMETLHVILPQTRS